MADMKMSTKPFWLPKAIDVKITDMPTPTGTGFCVIRSIDYYEDIEEQDGEELARFGDVYDAFEWLAANDYTPVDPGCEDGTYRHRQAAEWCYAQIDKKPVRVLKRAKEPVVMTPERQRILLMLTA